jgi:hypothetical protein
MYSTYQSVRPDETVPFNNKVVSFWMNAKSGLSQWVKNIVPYKCKFLDFR